MSSDKPTAIDAADALSEDIRARVRTLIPATILTYTDIPPLGPVATVQVTRMGASTTGQPFPYPPFKNCPVLWPRAGGMAIWGTLFPGDEVMLGIADRSMDEFLARPPLSPPLPQSSKRMHNLSDAVVFLGLSSTANALPPALNTFTVGREDGTATMKFTITGPGEVTIEATTIKLGTLAAESLVKGDAFKTFFNAHVHGAAGTPPTLPMDPVPGTHLSLKVKTS